MRITEHAKDRAWERIPETRDFSEVQLESYIDRLLRSSEILNHSEMQARFPGFSVQGETTYFVLKSLVFVVRSGDLVTIIELDRTPRRLMSYAN